MSFLQRLVEFSAILVRESAVRARPTVQIGDGTVVELSLGSTSRRAKRPSTRLAGSAIGDGTS